MLANCHVIVQARMSSSRFPGKVLAPLSGQPVIAHVFSRILEVMPKERVLLATSDTVPDDPLAIYVGTFIGVTVFRGPLNDVVTRFQHCLRAHPCDWFVRICGDSPALDPGLLRWMLERVTGEVDILTNVGQRTFPLGESIEIVRSDTFLRLQPEDLTSEEREHVTQYFYRNPASFRIGHVSARDVSLRQRRLVVDTLEDLHTLERILAADAASTRGYAAHAHLGEEAA